MAITVANFIPKVRRQVADAVSAQITDAEILDFTNEAVRSAMRRIAGVHPEYWLRTGEVQKVQWDLAVNTENYDLPADFFTELLVRLSDDEKGMECLTLERTLDSDAEGYIFLDDDIYICPTPDDCEVDGLTMYYLARPTEVSSTSDTIPLSDDFEDAILYYVAVKIRARQDKNATPFTGFYQLIQGTLDALMNRTNRPTGDGLHVAWRSMI